ncbi:PEP-utilizing enzyme [Streptomyces sp. NPDC015131]|uniref:PEP-utilizing enzyme n=1 Tax=Streptomyces sp. NPDC015131 TaxID=3364941 RepID=UPI0036F88A67
MPASDSKDLRNRKTTAHSPFGGHHLGTVTRPGTRHARFEEGGQGALGHDACRPPLATHETTPVLRAAAGRALAPTGAVPVCSGIGVAPDCASGVLCTTPAECASAVSMGTPYVYARPVTHASDMPAAANAAALLTAGGGTTSHAAVLARTWEKPSVVGAGFTLGNGRLNLPDGDVLPSGEWVTVCATTGTVWRGRLDRHEDERALDLVRKLSEAAETLTALPGPAVYPNADTLAETERCTALGATGVGVARSEHMFFGADELPQLRIAL